MGDQVEVLVEIGESQRELAVEKDQLAYAIEQELGKLGKDSILANFFAIWRVGLVISKYTFCSVGMKNGVHM